MEPSNLQPELSRSERKLRLAINLIKRLRELDPQGAEDRIARIREAAMLHVDLSSDDTAGEATEVEQQTEEPVKAYV